MDERDAVLPSVADVLSLPEVRRGQPEVVAGAGSLHQRVRWVHVSELPDIAHLLQGGELILTTGIALPTAASDLERFVSELAGAPASGLVIELGRRFTTLPPTLVRMAERRALPLVALAREVRFVRITEAVHSLIVNSQVEQLRRSATIHRRFTDLGVEGASAEQIMETMRELTGRPVVLENLTHQVVAYATADAPAEELLDDWERRSRLITTSARTEFTEADRPWLVTRVGARGEHWGRLLMQLDGPASMIHATVLEQGAAALALNRLVEREHEALERQAHRALIDDLRTGSYSSAAEALLRAEALGVPLRGRRLLGLVVRGSFATADGDGAAESLREAATSMARAARDAQAPALVGADGVSDVVLVLAVPCQRDVRQLLEDVARRIHRHMAKASSPSDVVIGRGSVVDEVADLRRSLQEAEQVVSATGGVQEEKLCYEPSDIGISGLLYLLRDDPRLQRFVESELAALLNHDSAHGTELVHALSTYLAGGRNKSAVAAHLGVTRPTLYQRLRRVERVLDVDLGRVDRCLSLHVAVLALQVMRRSLEP